MKNIDLLRDRIFATVYKFADSVRAANYEGKFERSFIFLKIGLNELNLSSREDLSLGLHISIKGSGFLIQLNDERNYLFIYFQLYEYHT